MILKKYLSKQAKLIDSALKKCLPKDNSLISRAMRYSVFAGGKRLRPILVMEGAKICGGDAKSVLPAACAVEFIHTYSLIHDDLPAMDNDDLRRGKPTSHKKFDEATAILAGDALLTDSFRLLCECNKRKDLVITAVKLLSEAAGHKGMIEGQIKDSVELKNWKKESKNKLRKKVIHIHKNKTASLICASLKIGAVLSGASRNQIKSIEKYGWEIGLAFQIVDDILDVVGDKAILGKRGSDKDNNKLTYPALYGLNNSSKLSVNLIKNAKKNLKTFGKRASILNQLADFIVERKY
ncbi:MAG: polyprenyl synthetase family protein [Endomicrobiales bacterium]|nr:polyprenyl synthetase family protein [Endomicrobiales bacterium]